MAFDQERMGPELSHRVVLEDRSRLTVSGVEEVERFDENTVVLSTASPYKFPAAVLEGLGEKAEGDEFAVMEQLERLTGVPAPKNLCGLRERPVRHTTVLDREEMLPFVLEKAQEKKWF